MSKKTIIISGGDQGIQEEFVQKVKEFFSRAESEKLNTVFKEGINNLSTDRDGLKKSTINRLNIMLNQYVKHNGTLSQSHEWYIAIHTAQTKKLISFQECTIDAKVSPLEAVPA